MNERIKTIRDRIPGEEVITAEGWVRTKRDGKNVCFLEINDGSCLKGLQAVIDKNTFTDNNLLDQITTGAAVKATGKIVKSQGGEQGVELSVETLELVGPCPADYPLQKKRHTVEFLREKAHLRPRTNLFGAVTRVRNTMAYAESDTAIGERNMNSATGDIFLFRLVRAAAAVVRTVLSGTKRSVKMIVWPMLLMNASSLNSLI